MWIVLLSAFLVLPPFSRTHIYILPLLAMFRGDTWHEMPGRTWFWLIQLIGCTFILNNSLYCTLFLSCLCHMFFYMFSCLVVVDSVENIVVHTIISINWNWNWIIDRFWPFKDVNILLQHVYHENEQENYQFQLIIISS